MKREVSTPGAGGQARELVNERSAFRGDPPDPVDR